MPILTIYRTLKALALNEFSDVVVHARILTLSTGDPLKLRLGIADGTFLDVFISASGRYSYHWERRSASQRDLYRHDNAPTIDGSLWQVFPSTFTTAATAT